MSNKIQEEEKSQNNNSISFKYSKSKKKISQLEIEGNNSSKGAILRNAGKELFDSNRYFATEENSQNFPHSQSIINLKHKGIKRKGHSLYDPYLIQVCKNAIIKEKKELPNYKEIIKKINTEYGIEDEKFNDNDLYDVQKANLNNNNNNNSSNLPDISSFNNSSHLLKDINNSAMSTNIIEKRYKNILFI